MAILTTGNDASPKPAPMAEPKQAPTNDAKTPAGNKAAKEAPNETKAAAKAAFGDAPTGNNAKEDSGSTSSNQDAKNGDAPKTPNDAGQDAKVPAGAKAPDDRPKTNVTAPDGAPTENVTTGTEAGAPATPDPAAHNSKDAKSAGDGKTSDGAKASDSAKTPDSAKDANGAKPPNGAKAPNGAKTPAGANANVPQPAEPVDDPKQTEAPEAMLVFQQTQTILFTEDANGKTAIANAQEKTLQDLKAYAKGLEDKKQPPDAIAKYYKYKLAQQAALLGLATGADPKDPRMPKTTLYQDEKTTGDVFDMDKIAAGLKEAENDPAVQEYLASKQASNLDAELSKMIANGTIPDMPKDPGTGSYAKYLADKQKEAINDPQLAAAIAKMPVDKQQEALGKAVGPLAGLGVKGKDSKGELINLINKVADITGQQKPVVDANNDFVISSEGHPVVRDPDSGLIIAMTKDGKKVLDEQTQLPKIYGPDGNPVNPQFSQILSPLVLSKSGDAVSMTKDGYLQVMGTDKYGNQWVPLTNPDNQLNKIIIDPVTNAPVELDAMSAKIVLDEGTGLPKVVDTSTGKSLVNPSNGNTIVASKTFGAAVEIDKATGKIVTDAAGNAVVVDPKTGYQVWDKNNNPVVSDKDSRLPVVVNPTTGIKMVMNPKTGEPLFDPTKGSTVILDPDTKVPVAAITSKETGELIKNTNGQIAHIDTATGIPVLTDATTGTKTIVDPATGLAVQDPNGNTLFLDKSSGLAMAKGPDGKEVVEANSGAKIIYNPTTGLPFGKPDSGAYTVLDPRTGIPVEVDTNGKFTVDNNGKVAVMNVASGQNLVTQDGLQVVLDEKSKLPVADNKGNLLVVNPYSGEYIKDPVQAYNVMVDPKTNNTVFLDPLTGQPRKDPATGNIQVANAKTGDALTDPFGQKIQIDPNTGVKGTWNEDAGKLEPTAPDPVPVLDDSGGQLTTPDGYVVAQDGTTGYHILIDQINKQPVTEAKSGLVQLADAKGGLLLTPEGNKVVIDKDSSVPVSVGADGKVIVDPKANSLVYSGTTGKQVVDAAGNPVVLDNVSGAPVMTDKATGAPLVEPKSGLTLVADAVNGGAVVDKQAGNTVVLEKDSNAPVLVGPAGTVLQDADGNAYLASTKTAGAITDPNGNKVVVDKNVGVPVVVDATTGTKTMVDAAGNPMKEPKTGADFIIGKNGLPQAVLTDKDGTQIVIDPATGEQAVDGNGNKVYIDSTTGQMVANTPSGIVDVLTGQPPVIPGPNFSKSETMDKIFKVIRNSIGSVYWGTFGVAGADFALKNTEFFKNTANFHASRMVASMSGLATMVFAAIRWAPGTKQKELLDTGDVQAGLQFGEDISAVFKYFGFYPKTVDGLVKVIHDKPTVAGDLTMTMKTDPATGAVVKYSFPGATAVNAGDINPVTGAVATTNGMVDVPEGFRSSVFLKKGQTNPFTGQQVKQSGWLDLPDGTYNPNTGLGALAGAGEPVGAKFSLTTYSKFAAHWATKAVSAAANFSMGLGNTVGGALQLYKGGKQIQDGIATKNDAAIAEGVFNIIGGTAFSVVGVSGAVSAVTEMGALGKKLAEPLAKLIAKVASAGNIAGVGLFIANFATAIAGIIGLAREKHALGTTHEVWADLVMETFKDVDAFKGSEAEVKAILEDWYKKYAQPYYNEKMKESQAGNYSQDGSNPNNAGTGVVPNGA